MASSEYDKLIQCYSKLTPEELKNVTFFVKFLVHKQNNDPEKLTAEDCSDIREFVKFVMNDNSNNERTSDNE